MLRDIVMKEILDIIHSPKFVFTFLLCTVLILLSVYTGIDNYRSELREYNAAVVLNRKNLENQQNYTTLAGIGTKINKQPTVLSAVTTGIQKAVGRQATVNIAYDPSLVDSKYDSNPVLAVFGELDLTLIVRVVLSLLAILFTYDAISGERERGTLKLSLSNRIPRDRMILGKALGGLASLLVPLVIPFVIGLIMLMLYPDISFTGDEWLRIGFIFLLFLLYLSLFFSLGLMVSSFTRRSSSSLFILLFAWVVFVFVVPKTAVILAGQINPIPSVHEVTAQKEAFLQEIQGSARQEVLDWRGENPSDNTPEYQERFRAFLEDLQQRATSSIDERNAGLEVDYQAKRRKQQTLALYLSRLSPASALTVGAENLGLTGVREHERFLNSIKQYKPVFTKWANTKMMQSLDLGNTGEQEKPDISDMPRHEFEPEKLSESLAAALPDYLVMALMTIVFFMAAYVSFLRYDVR